MTDHKDDDLDLETLFQEARATPIPVDGALMARVLADSMDAQPNAKRSGRIWPLWGGASGLVTATVVGVWMGVSPPQNLPDFAAPLVLASLDIDDAFDDEPFETGFGWDFEEG